MDTLGQRALAFVVPALRTRGTEPNLFVDALDDTVLSARDTLEHAALNVGLHGCFGALVRGNIAVCSKRTNEECVSANTKTRQEEDTSKGINEPVSKEIQTNKKETTRRKEGKKLDILNAHLGLPQKPA